MVRSFMMSTEMSMKQRSCGMRIAVTEREAIAFNAKRTKKMSTEMSMKQRNSGMRIAVREARVRSTEPPFNAKRAIKEVHGNDILKKV